MKAAMELLYGAGAFHQAPATVRADIVMGFDPVGRGAHHHDGILENVIDHKIPDFRDFLLAAGHLPDMGPQAFGLKGSKILTEIDILGHEIVAHLIGRKTG